MTRRGSLAYYLAAWVIGCFIVATGYWICEVRTALPGGSPNLLFIFFIASLLGIVDILIFGFALRSLMRMCKTHAILFWIVAGASLAVVLISLLAWLEHGWHRLSDDWQANLHIFYQIFLLGPSLLRDTGLLAVFLEGAATGAVLCLVDRAFAQEHPRQTEARR